MGYSRIKFEIIFAIFMIIKLIFIVSLSGVLIVIFRKIPRLLRFSLESKAEERGERVPRKKILDIENLEKNFSLWLGKLFKKFRIYALRFENLSARLSTKFHERSKSLSEPKKDYWGQFKAGEKPENQENDAEQI